jgi:predicted nucleic acid-binding protein
MWLLDTMVLSETIKPSPEAKVLDWLGAQEPEAMFTSALCLGEVRFGIERLGPGRRREALRAWLRDDLLPFLGSQILNFDADCATAWAELRAVAPRTLSTVDSLIAATALAHDLRIVTRNVADFDGAGVALFNPWT